MGWKMWIPLVVLMLPLTIGLAKFGQWTIRRNRMRCVPGFAWQRVRGANWEYVPHEDETAQVDRPVPSPRDEPPWAEWVTPSKREATTVHTTEEHAALMAALRRHRQASS